MAEFRRDFRAAPVPIRLSCPFSNGITLNYYARALTCNSRVLRVLSVNPFDRELQLMVAAPFISGISRCLVASVTRSKRQASTYEIDLRFIESPVLLGNRDNASAGLAAFDEPAAESGRQIPSAASELALALERNLGLPFAAAFAQATSQDSHFKLLALASAVVDLSCSKGLANMDVVRKVTKGRLPGQTAVVSPSPRELVSDRRTG